MKLAVRVTDGLVKSLQLDLTHADRGFEYQSTPKGAILTGCTDAWQRLLAELEDPFETLVGGRHIREANIKRIRKALQSTEAP